MSLSAGSGSSRLRRLLRWWLNGGEEASGLEDVGSKVGLPAVAMITMVVREGWLPKKLRFEQGDDEQCTNHAFLIFINLTKQNKIQ